MRRVKASYDHSCGVVRIEESAPALAPAGVILYFLDEDDQRWEEIIHDPTPRPALSELADRAIEDLRAGRSIPIDLDDPRW